MRKALALSILVTILAFTAYLLKPSEEACVNKALEAYKQRISYTVDSAPKELNKAVFAKLLEKNFLQKLVVADKFLYKEIYQKKAGVRNKIGWAAFGLVQVTIN